MSALRRAFARRLNVRLLVAERFNLHRLFVGRSEQGSQTTEYALLIVVSATIASLALAWARKGAIAALLDVVMKQVRGLFGIG
jgi:hypothetical protein